MLSVVYEIIFLFPPPPNTLTLICSGLLTGKFSRGETPAPGTSRLGWVEENKQARSNQSHPSLSEYTDKDSYWQLMDVMRKIANKHGKFFICMDFQISHLKILEFHFTYVLTAYHTEMHM